MSGAGRDHPTGAAETVPETERAVSGATRAGALGA
jgi:hypothetical protein